MTYRVPDTQIVPTFSGTFGLSIEGVASGSFEGLAADDWMSIVVSGTMGFISPRDGRPPIGWGGMGTLGLTYSDNTAGGAWDDITGCSCTFDARVERDYLVLLAVNWVYASSDWMYEYLGIGVNGSSTGVTFPNQVVPDAWFRRRDTAPPFTNEYDMRLVPFIIRSLPTGTYTVQARHSPWGSNQNRGIVAGAAFVMVL